MLNGGTPCPKPDLYTKMTIYTTKPSNLLGLFCNIFSNFVLSNT